MNNNHSSFNKALEYYEQKIYRNQALFLVQSGNEQQVLAKNTAKKLCHYKRRLMHVFLIRMQRLRKKKIKCFKNWCSQKKMNRVSEKFYSHARKCPGHRKKVFKEMIDSDVDFFISGSLRVDRFNVTMKKCKFECAQSKYVSFMSFSKELKRLNVF